MVNLRHIPSMVLRALPTLGRFPGSLERDYRYSSWLRPNARQGLCAANQKSETSCHPV
ncbi:hypothetical protein K491DRAFT_699097 [Lophiostoma macrostomum CBS 122681]|uniref:Uncharacterized protein n=1 Tax=Lophiostoma macrostomum CBS 122681 TaxID=1314788 RepID=A0A6A6SK20_9PLEO|nr:hypothetical protein K491DRAFT_699097 [Lophiostoma macrostomum CBS 122681]